MSTKLFVGNLSFKTTENDLQDAFAAFMKLDDQTWAEIGQAHERARHRQN